MDKNQAPLLVTAQLSKIIHLIQSLWDKVNLWKKAKAYFSEMSLWTTLTLVQMAESKLQMRKTP